MLSVIWIRDKTFEMSEKELNSYRFLSGEEPTEEMLESIMKDALQSALSRKQAAEARIKADIESQRAILKKKWENLMKRSYV